MARVKVVGPAARAAAIYRTDALRRTRRSQKQQQQLIQTARSSAGRGDDQEEEEEMVQGHAQSLSNFIYYKKGGQELNIDVRMGSLLHEHCDALAFSVDDKLHLNAALSKRILSRTGCATAVKKTIEAAKKAQKEEKGFGHISGDVVAVDLHNSDNTNGWKTLLFVVSPYELSLLSAYTNILKICKEKELESVAIVGLGCGQRGVSGKMSASDFMKSLLRYDVDHGPLDKLKTIAILDVQRHVVSAFISRLRDIVAEHSYRQANEQKLVFVSNDKMLDYEAKRLTREVEPEQTEDSDCVVCMCGLKEPEGEEAGQEPVRALKCGHQFHFECFKNYLGQCVTRKCCPICRSYFAMPCGNQPASATMSTTVIRDLQLPGHEEVSAHTICISYDVPGGMQDDTHLRPGLPFRGTRRVAYLPHSDEGMKVLRLLKKAFECRLIFTVGDSVTTGVKNVVTWNSIHHKTSTQGGAAYFGYPDETYFVRVRAELEEAGITEDLLTEEELHGPVEMSLHIGHIH